MSTAQASSAPIGDMMVVVGDALFGQGHGRTFMLCEAFTVFLALIGTTLSCINTGARVTYAMGKDKEVGGNFGGLHSTNLTPHRAIWTLATISAIIGCVAVVLAFGDGAAPSASAIAAIPPGFWSSVGYTTHEKMAALPNSLLMVTLASNFGTFLLYCLSCATCMVAYHKHINFSVLRHFLIPLFGIVANLACMAFYLIGPFMGYGTKMEPLLALGIAFAWAAYGALHFVSIGKAHGKPTLLTDRNAA
jgi:amino acid transporter